MSGALEEGGEGGGKSVEDRLRRLLGAATSRFDQMRVDIQEMTQYREKHDSLLTGLEELLQVGWCWWAVHWVYTLLGVLPLRILIPSMFGCGSAEPQEQGDYHQAEREGTALTLALTPALRRTGCGGCRARNRRAGG